MPLISKSSTVSSDVLASLDDLARLQSDVTSSLDRCDARQQKFKQKYARETRKHRQIIFEAAVNSSNMNSSVMRMLSHSTDSNADKTEKTDITVSAKLKSRACNAFSAYSNTFDIHDPKYEHILRGLSCFYVIPDAMTDSVCDQCGAFRSVTMLESLPSNWCQYYSDLAKKNYFYNSLSKQVSWTPPNGTDEVSRHVFEKTGAVDTVCRCIPSSERRKRLMQKFREYAKDLARQEAIKQKMDLQGAFEQIALRVLHPDE